MLVAVCFHIHALQTAWENLHKTTELFSRKTVPIFTSPSCVCKMTRGIPSCLESGPVFAQLDGTLLSTKPGSLISSVPADVSSQERSKLPGALKCKQTDVRSTRTASA